MDLPVEFPEERDKIYREALAFRIVAPLPGQRTAFEENRGADAGASCTTKRMMLKTSSLASPSRYSLDAGKNRPSWFLVAENDRMIPVKTQHFESSRMKATVRAHAVDHSPMLTSPRLVVEVIHEAVRATFRGN